MSNERKSIFSRVDSVTFLLYIVLVFIGLTTVFSVEYRSTDASIFIMSKSHMKQFTWFGVSLFFGLIILWTESKFFSSFAFLFYTIGIALLVLTIFAGKNVKGSHSWLGVGSFAFQPGEVCKIFTSLALAKFLSLPETNFQTLKHRLIGIAIAMVPSVIIILQDETGLALVYFCFFLVMYREGLPNAFLIIGFSGVILALASLLVDRMLLFLILTGLAIIVGVLMRNTIKRNIVLLFLIIGVWGVGVGFSQFLVPFTFTHVLKGYQIDRVYSMLGKEVPEEYVSNAIDSDEDLKKKRENASDYNVTQSKIAIGSGGLLGKGFLNGTSTKNDFVPEQNTDFIFCAVGEQFGFVGSAILVLIYLALMLRILFLAERQRSPFSRVYGYCVASILFFHFAINLSMTIGLAPVIGITLPFLSYGGSSLLSFSILIFILLRLDVDRQVMIR
ncbi:MAG TPA: rod shape-determining protein RodA [Flavipsychrobacter sp.]|nr:rod shape-determining protein RodA [Flavipsychrobacter sp.]